MIQLKLALLYQPYFIVRPPVQRDKNIRITNVGWRNNQEVIVRKMATNIRKELGSR